MKSENLNIVIVTYNNRELLRKCIESVEASRKNVNLNSIITVVDNASNDGTEDEIRRYFPEINYIKNDKNYGLAKALNIGIKNSIASDFTLLLNDDVELFDDTIKRMIDVLEEHPEASGVPARLVYPDGSPQRIKLNIIGINKKLKDEITYVKFAGTTASLYRTEIFRKIGFFDEFYFFYNEDLDFCLRVSLLRIRTIHRNFRAPLGEDMTGSRLCKWSLWARISASSTSKCLVTHSQIEPLPCPRGGIFSCCRMDQDLL